jgi:hypothetical protein
MEIFIRNVGDPVKASDVNQLTTNDEELLEVPKVLLQFHPRGQRTTDSATYVSFNNVNCSFFWDGDHLQGLKIRWEIGYYMEVGAGTCKFRLYNVTNSSAVADSEVSLAETTTPTQAIFPVSSANYFDLPSGEKLLRPQFLSGASGKIFYIDFLRLVAVKV